MAAPASFVKGPPGKGGLGARGRAAAAHPKTRAPRAPVSAGLAEGPPKDTAPLERQGSGAGPPPPAWAGSLPQRPSGSFAPKAALQVRAPRRARRRAPGSRAIPVGRHGLCHGPCQVGLAVRGTPPPRRVFMAYAKQFGGEASLGGLGVQVRCAELAEARARRPRPRWGSGWGRRRQWQVSPRRPRPGCAKAGAIIGWRVDGIALTWSDRSQ